MTACAYRACRRTGAHTWPGYCDGEVALCEPHYRQSEARSCRLASGPIELRPDVTATAIVVFEGAQLGGRLFLGGSSADFTQNFEVEFSVG